MDSRKTGVRGPFLRLAARAGLSLFMPQPPRKMHWNLVPTGRTACDKDASRCRTTVNINHWRNLKLAGGRRCLRCLQYVGQVRRFDEPKAVS